MPRLITPESCRQKSQNRTMIAAEVKHILECLKAALGEVEAAFQRTFDLPTKILLPVNLEKLEVLSKVNEAQNVGRCLVVSFRFPERNVALLIPDHGQIPAWADDPDPTGRSKLATLAQELGILLFPPEWPLQDSTALVVPSGATILGDFMSGETAAVSLPLKMGDRDTSLLILTGRQRANVEGNRTPQNNDKDVPPAEKSPQNFSVGAIERAPRPATGRESDRASLVPLLTRSLLKIKVPVEVILAKTRRPLIEILRMGPGTIIQFDKLCDEPLDLAVNGFVIARGEAVKVGDKFGLRILEMVPPPERCVVLSGRVSQRTGSPAKLSSK